jgi:Ca-activated chloride channel homolog
MLPLDDERCVSQSKGVTFPHHLKLCAAAFLGALGPRAGQNSPPPQAQILSPGQDTFVSGPTLLRARVQPIEAAATVIFFVDGRQVCALTKLPFECEWDPGASIREHQVRLVVNLVSGGRLVEAVRTKALDVVEKVDVDVVQVTVTVADSRGRFVKGLPKSAFRVSEDGRPQTISHFASENVPLELLVAVDISGSMTPAMPKLKTAVKAFLTAVPSENQLTLLAFNDTLFTLTRRATDPAERVRAVDRLAPWGSTALYDAILRGVELLGRQTGRRALIVFSDGEDQGSHATIADVERRLQASDIVLYMIGQGRGTTVESLKKVLQRLATPTGGRALFTEKIDELQGAFDELLDELSNQYLLAYPPADVRRDDKWHRISVDVEGRYDVRARQGYRASSRK